MGSMECVGLDIPMDQQHLQQLVPPVQAVWSELI